jgi:hypothetical protein
VSGIPPWDTVESVLLRIEQIFSGDPFHRRLDAPTLPVCNRFQILASKSIKIAYLSS